MNAQEQATRDVRLAALGFDSYAAYVKSPLWARTRSGFWRLNRGAACVCGATERLQIHHKTYVRLGEELLDDLQALCDPCHKTVHALDHQGVIGLDEADRIVNADRAATYAPGVAARKAKADHERYGGPVEQTKRQSRRIRSLIRERIYEAARDGRDIVPLLDEIERLLKHWEGRQP